jgi:hypothetical protein
MMDGIGHNSGYDADVDYSADVDDAALDVVPTDAKLARVRDLAKLQVEREREVADLEAKLAIATTKLDEVRKRDLPMLLRDLGIKKLPLANGASIDTKKKTVVGVIKENEDAFFDWMSKHGFNSLIKRVLKVEFGRGEAKRAGMLWAVICRHYKDFIHTDAEAIHASTLNAWGRELQESNAAALAAGGKVIEPPDYVKFTDLLESVIVIPKGKVVEWT